MNLKPIAQKFLQKATLKKLSKYIIGGAFAAGIDLIILYLCTEHLGYHYLQSQIIAFAISFICGFLFQKLITFENTSKTFVKQGLLFLAFQLVGLGINLIILRIGVEYFGIHYLICSVFAKGVVFVRNFIMNHFYNFK